jgi:hypothetical protein
MKILALTVAPLFAASPVAAQTSQTQQPLGATAKETIRHSPTPALSARRKWSRRSAMSPPARTTRATGRMAVLQRPARLLLLSRPVEKVWCLRTSCATEAIRFEAHIAVPLTTRRLEGCPMTTCPICRSEAAALPKTGDADGFDCHEHGKFKVASSVFATKNPNREQWEAALKRAETRRPDAWAPVILIDDFR